RRTRRRTASSIRSTRAAAPTSPTGAGGTTPPPVRSGPTTGNPTAAERHMGTLLQDLRYGLRSLTHRPGFAAVAIVTLALGIGLNAAVFTVVDAALVRSVPYAEPERLVHLWQVQDNAERRPVPFAWQTLRELQDSGLFASVAGYQPSSVAWTGRPDPEELPALNVTANFLDVLGVRPALGRGFLPGEDVAGGPRAVVLTDAFWRTRFGADPRIL